ncbi:uncharacterized protein LOC135947027 [Cloeon dipterum]|uniref:uncharacterized protein LOC135947027 n=1 Tax=Cloeon dipterum TaxID=197152 RepID=UPI003220212E
MNSPGSNIDAVAAESDDDSSSDEKGGQIPAKNEDSAAKDSSESEARTDDSQASTVPYVEKTIESLLETSFCSSEDNESIHLKISSSEGEEDVCKDPFMGISFSDNSLKNWVKNPSPEEPPLSSTPVYVDSSKLNSGFKFRPSNQSLSPNQKSTTRSAVSPSWSTDICLDEEKPTSESRSSDTVRNFKPNPKMLNDSTMKDKLNRFLDVLIGHEHARFVFSRSPSKSKHFVSERPMNIEGLRKKLNDGLFSSGEAFLRDLKLMLQDAALLNPTESGIPEKACIMEGVLSYLWSATFKHFPLKDDTPKPTSFDAEAVKTSFPLSKGALERPQ